MYEVLQTSKKIPPYEELKSCDGRRVPIESLVIRMYYVSADPDAAFCLKDPE
jgi:hypothetical protein